MAGSGSQSAWNNVLRGCGATAIAVWQWITALSESGDIPLGIGGGNYGATDFAPHVITTVGVVMMLLAILGGLLAKPRSAAS